MRQCLLIFVVLAISGCQQNSSFRPVNKEPDKDLSFVAAALRNSPSYQSLKSRSKVGGFIIEDFGPDWCVVSIGEYFSDHFSRQGSLKVLRTGEVFRQSDRTGLTDGWIVEYHPGETQLDLNEAAAADAMTPDAELKDVYDRLLDALSAPERTRLTDAEAAWLEYRKKQCDLEVSGYEGGSIAPMVYWQCHARMTRARVAELQDELTAIH